MKYSIASVVLAVSLMANTQVASAQGHQPAPATVTPGNSHTNNDGVTATNNGDSGGNMTVNPAAGTVDSATTVDCQNDVTGSVTGLDANDTVNVTSGGNVSVTGTGGTVNVNGSGASVTITNNAPPGGANIIAHGPGGTTVTIPPGSSATIST